MNFRKEIFVGVMLTFLISNMSLFAFHISPVKSTRWTVDDDGPADFHSIQDAVNNASSGDSIYVYNGTYYEAVVIDETLDALTLTGEDRNNTIINGSGFQYLGALVTILANNVTLSGFTVTKARREAILLENSTYCKVHDNIVCFTGDRGIVAERGGNNVVYLNLVYNSSYYGGIEAIRSNHNVIYDNTVYFNQWGIATNNCSYNEIFGNTIHSNRESGIHIDWPSTENSIHHNNITSNVHAGIRVFNRANSTVISHNTISRSSAGIHLADSFANIISENYITENHHGMVLSPSENNSIHHNSFIENIHQVGIHPSRFNLWDNHYPSGGNYWSDYTGIDLYSGRNQNETGSDGIGDTPYIIDENNTDRYPLIGVRDYEDRVTQVVSTESAGNSQDPSLAVDPNGTVHVAWHDQTDLAGCGSDYDILYKRFEADAGWSLTKVVSTESTSDSYYPSLAVDPNGTIHVAWHDQTDLECGTDWDIFYKKYEVGTGWTTTEVVSTESTANSLRPSLAVDPNGTIHVAWHDQTDLECGTDWDIFYKKYEANTRWIRRVYRLSWNVDPPHHTDSGSDANAFHKECENRTQGGWTTTEVVSTESTANSLRPSLAVDLDGNIHISWDDATDYVGCGTDPDIFYKRYETRTQGGWTTTEVVSAESTLASYDSCLDIDFRGNVHVAWEDKTDQECGIDWDIFYKKLPAGSNWTATEVVSTESTEASFFPALAADLAGNIHVAWCDNTSYTGCGNDFDVFFKIWEVGMGWTTTEVVSTDSLEDSWDPSLATDMAKNVHIAWTDYSNYAGSGEDPDIFYKYIRLHSTRYPWSMFRCNSRHTGYVKSPAPNTNQTQWTYTTGGAVDSSPAVVDGIVYVGSNDGKVYALDQHTGAQIWNQTTGLSVSSSPAVVDGRVYVGSDDGKVYCLNALTGTHIWNQTTGDYVTSSPAVTNGKVYIGSDDGKVYCLNALTGTHIWNQTTGGYVTSSPAVADGMVFVGSNDHTVYAFGVIVRVPEDYPTVQEAIDAAEGTAILIAPGVYHETLVVNKTLTIIGRRGSAPVFDGGGSGIAVTLLSGASGSTVAGIVITNYDQGILMVDSGNCKIYDNVMSLMEYSGIALDGSGAVDNQIYSNVIEDNTVAVDLLESSTSNTVYKNIIALNDVAVNLGSGGNVVYGNTLIENDVGINLTDSGGNVIYHNNFINNNVEDVLSGGNANVWDNGYPSGGNYWSGLTGQDLHKGPAQDILGSDGILDANHTIASNNVDRYPLAQPFNPHDIGITSIYKSKNVIGQGYNLNIEIRMLNYGIHDETFTLTVYANSTSIAAEAITLAKRNSTTITIQWDTSASPKGNYTIEADITTLPDEIYIDDNTFSDGWIIVAMIADITGPDGWPDGKCDMRDIGAVARLFGKNHPDPEYNPDYDIVYDHRIDMRDIGTTARHFGETDP